MKKSIYIEPLTTIKIKELRVISAMSCNSHYERNHGLNGENIQWSAKFVG